MYKNEIMGAASLSYFRGFNPCFNGTMYKNFNECLLSIQDNLCFNPCFNGTMYKNPWNYLFKGLYFYVSILVLMELCIKTGYDIAIFREIQMFQSLF